MTVDQILTILRATPDRLATVAASATADQLRMAPEPGEWSATEVLAHLRSCADVWGSAIERILAEHKPTVKAVNPTTWIESTDYRELQYHPSLKAFARQRAHLLSVLEPLSPRGWERTAKILGAGRELETSVHTYANRLARHERTHCKQVERTVNAVTS
jgi:hypothetical protein